MALPRLNITWLVALALFSFVTWGAVYELDQTVQAVGQIVPGTRTQIIQAADGGVLEKLMVKEGQDVKAGQLLATLEKERANASVEEGLAKLAYLQAALLRAKAEAQNLSPDFGSVPPRYREFAREQEALYRQRQRSLQDELGALEMSLKLAEDELTINQKLMQTGDISSLDLMRSQRQVAELRGRRDAVKNKYLQDARQEVAKLQDDLSSQKFKLDERRSVLDHARLTSPVDGVVKSLRLNTLGGVLRAGDELMQISPTDVELVAEIKINPADVGQLRIGLPVAIKVDSFDYTVYGSLNGILSYLSSDTLPEKIGNGGEIAAYKAQVTINNQQKNPKIRLQDLKPGMTVSVAIQTGKRNVLTYITKPVTKAFQGAGSER